MMTFNEHELPIREFQDRGMRWLLELPENLGGVLQLLAREIADHLDFHQAEQINRSLLSVTLQKRETDLLYRVPFIEAEQEIWIYVLLEHQSTPERLMGLRMLDYMVRVWDIQRRRWEDEHKPENQCRLSPILPIVLYTGQDSWSVLPTLETIMQAPAALAPFIPRHETLFLNLREMPAEALQGTAIAYALQLLQARDAPKEEFKRILAGVVTHLEQLSEEHQAAWRRALQFLLLLIQYQRAVNEREELVTLVIDVTRGNHREEVKDMVLTGAQALKQEGSSEILLTQLIDKFGKLPANVEMTVKEMSLTGLKQLAHRILTAQTLSELHLEE